MKSRSEMGPKYRGRFRHQNGSLRMSKGTFPKWYAKWYSYGLDGKRKQHSRVIGLCAEMTEAQAREILRSLIDRDTRLSGVFTEKLGIIPIAFGENAKHLAFHNGGVLAELLVCADLLNKGWEIFRPISATATCDLIAVKGSAAVRVEVKKARLDGSPHRRLLTSIKRNIAKFDLAAFVLADTGEIYYFEHDFLLTNPRPPANSENHRDLAYTYHGEASSA